VNGRTDYFELKGQKIITLPIFREEFFHAIKVITGLVLAFFMPIF
jgi:hypothetical protein